MEECQAVITRVPPAIAVAMVLLPALLPSPLLWRCCRLRCYGVAAVAVAVVSLPLARHAGVARSNSNTPPLLVHRTKQKSTKSETKRKQNHSH